MTGAGKRYDIVACFAGLTRTVVADPSPLAPARHAAHVRASVPLIDDPDYIPALESLCEQHGVGAVLPLTDLDIEVLARARADGRLPALVPSVEVAHATYDKYETHLLLQRLSPALAADRARPRTASTRSTTRSWSSRAAAPARARSTSPATPRRRASSPTTSPSRRWCSGRWAAPSSRSTASATCEGRCLNAIPRTMLESRGGESIKGQVVHDEELIELGRRTMEALSVCGPATIQVFRDPDIGLGITDVNTRFGGAFPAPVYAALEGRTYPELIVRLAAGEAVSPHVGEFRAGMTFTRYYWQLELDEQLEATGREIVPGGPPSPR